MNIKELLLAQGAVNWIACILMAITLQQLLSVTRLLANPITLQQILSAKRLLAIFIILANLSAISLY